jgi:hypothetical protein
MSVSNKDNRRRGAQQLGAITGTRAVKGFVGEKDRIDYFQFRASGRSDVSLRLDRLKANADLTLLNASGVLVGQSRKKNKKPESIAAQLEAGVYYVGVRSRKGDTRYRLRTTVSALPIANPPISNPPISNPPISRPPSEPGNSLPTARDLGVLSSQRTISDFVGTGDSADYYKFSLNQIQQLSATLTGVTDNTSLEIIYDANKNGVVDAGEIAISDSGTGNVSLTKTLPQGNYFIKVAPRFSFDNPGGYQLTLTPTPDPGNLPSDPGNTAATASNLGALSGTRTLKDYVGTVDSGDWYKFNLSQISNISFTLNGAGTNNSTLSLIRDANNNGIYDVGELVTQRTTRNASIVTDLPTGNYFLAVERRFSTSDPGRYDLTLTTTADPGNLSVDPGDPAPKALNLGPLSGTRTLKDYVGLVDQADWYQFSLSSPRTLSATIINPKSVSSNDISLSLVRDSNLNGVVDGGELLTVRSGDNPFIVRALDAGTYFLAVESRFSTSDPGRYDLTLTV